MLKVECTRDQTSPEEVMPGPATEPQGADEPDFDEKPPEEANQEAPHPVCDEPLAATPPQNKYPKQVHECPECFM